MSASAFVRDPADARVYDGGAGNPAPDANSAGWNTAATFDPTRYYTFILTPASGGTIEYTPVRGSFSESSQDIFRRLQIHRNFRFGTLVEFVLTDERTYRSSHPSGESVPDVPDGFGARYLAPPSPGQTDPSRVMLGMPQRNAFISAATGAGAQWKARANELLLAPRTCR